MDKRSNKDYMMVAGKMVEGKSALPINLFPKLDKFFKDLYQINRLWFQVRNDLRGEDEVLLNKGIDKVCLELQGIEFYLLDVKERANERAKNPGN